MSYPVRDWQEKFNFSIQWLVSTHVSNDINYFYDSIKLYIEFAESYLRYQVKIRTNRILTDFENTVVEVMFHENSS